MTNSVCGCIIAAIQLSTDNSAKIADSDLHSTCCSSLSRTGNVDSRPTKCKCSRSIDACGGKEHGEIAYSRMVVLWGMRSHTFGMSCNDVVLIVG